MVTTLQGIKIAGIANAIPSSVVTAFDTAAHAGVNEKEAQKIAKMTGVSQRHVAPPELCTSDLSYEAAERLLAELNWDRNTIGALIFVSQTHDYKLPATACCLQTSLHLPSSCAAFDLALGCSGYVYGMWVAASLLASGSVQRALLLVGDTISRICGAQDRSTAFLFGDAASATALERDSDAPPMTFALGTDGSGQEFLIQRGGGSRNPARHDTSANEVDGNGNGNPCGPMDLYMNGAEVFAFTLASVPTLVSDVLEAAGWSMSEIDYFVPHQANKFMLEHLAKRMQMPAEKLMTSLEEFGNTSSASIPLTLGHKLSYPLKNGKANLLLAGFGVGWSWGAMAAQCGPMVIPDVIEVCSPK